MAPDLPNPATYTVPLNAGGLLLVDSGADNLGCPAAVALFRDGRIAVSFDDITTPKS
ncbi:MAG: hypothetical protein NVS3B26_12780 [Mycobacteriales bacterium]